MKENFLEHKIGITEFITGNRFIDICEGIDATFCKTDFIGEFHNSKQDLFITHNSDYPITCDSLSRGPSFKRWYAQNKSTPDPRVFSIPIGLENMTRRTSPAAAHGRFSSQVLFALQKALMMERINIIDLKKDGFVFMNFATSTYPKERQKVWEMFEGKSWVNASAHTPIIQKFYYDLASHKFAISPRGNGIDCHRTWEALYLKTVPIVRENIHMNDFRELPIYFVKDWNELCYDSLRRFYQERIIEDKFDLKKMKISYWRQVLSDICENNE